MFIRIVVLDSRDIIGAEDYLELHVIRPRVFPILAFLNNHQPVRHACRDAIGQKSKTLNRIIRRSTLYYEKVRWCSCDEVEMEKKETQRLQRCNLVQDFSCTNLHVKEKNLSLNFELCYISI
ncbi:hypothetical protein AVEN_8558-1 [Araneus ventricosus]|uniref:Uncharacterized protein n=1 Tax=Araneus ventricosus TaxID=182803 RepID=A0A4Y2GP45_ARAVE|nr:hypothetical protein AVEN_8558-1 [Araneus ventricosus]